MRQEGAGKEPEYRRQQKITTEHRQSAERHEQIIRTVITLAKSIDGVSAEHTASRQQAASHEEGKRKREWSTFSALIATATAAILTLIVTHCDTRDLISETQSAADQQHRDTVSALGKTDATIAAVQEQTAIMRGQLDEMQIDASIRRAELSATIKINLNPASGGGLTPSWINIGKTDAEHVRSWYQFKYFSNIDDLETFDFLSEPDEYKHRLMPVETVIPGDSITMPTILFTNEDAWAIMYRQKMPVFWSYIEYNNIFGDFYTARNCFGFGFGYRPDANKIESHLPHYLRDDCNRKNDIAKTATMIEKISLGYVAEWHHGQMVALATECRLILPVSPAECVHPMSPFHPKLPFEPSHSMTSSASRVPMAELASRELSLS
jgi:hypothetical protein